jgi:hypothetical protein
LQLVHFLLKAAEFLLEAARRGGLALARPRLAAARGKPPDMSRQVARLVLVDLAPEGRHALALAVEDAHLQLGLAPPRVPGGGGEIGNLRLQAARRTAAAVGPVAPRAQLPEYLTGGGGP